MMDAKQLIARIEARRAEHDGLLRELRLGAELLDRGIVRHDIVKRRLITTYHEGRRYRTGDADIIMRDGTHHVVPARLLWKTGDPDDYGSAEVPRRLLNQP